MSRTYTTQVRLLLCQSCGAPLQVSAAGGPVPCAYCGATNQVRQKAAATNLAPPQSSMDENQRMMALRSQDGKPLLPPQSLHGLLQGGGLSEAKVDEAFHYFNGTRREVEATSSPEAQERLFFLCLLLNNHLAKRGEHDRRRALLETALESLTLPRHVQVVRCWLATSSAGEGDVQSAQEWLAPCDPRSADLMADSAYPCAWAWVYIAQGDFQAVLRTLGATDEAYPIADAYDPVATLMRAHAVERLGDVPGAVRLLSSRMQAENRGGRQAMEHTRSLYPRFQLAEQSFPLAAAEHRKVAAKQSSAAQGGGAGTIFMVVGGLVLVIGLVVTVLPVGIGVLTALASGSVGPGGMLSAVGGGLFGSGIAFITTVPLGAIFLGVGFFMRRGAQAAAYIREHGVEAEGRVRSVSPTGLSVNNVPQMAIQVEVLHPQQGPYVATLKQMATAGIPSPGSTVPLRVHPEDPQKIVLDL